MNRTRTHSYGLPENHKIYSVTNGKISNFLTTNTTPPSQQKSPSKQQIGMVWAQSLDGVIGLDGAMPWHVPEDLQHFKHVTLNHVLVMGRRTWESFPASVRPLPQRVSVVVSGKFANDPSQDPKLADDDVHVVSDLQSGLELADQLKTSPMIWVVGGGSIYDQAKDVAAVVERSVFNISVDGDTYAPELDDSWQLVSQEPVDGWHTSSTGVQYRFERWERVLDETSNR